MLLTLIYYFINEVNVDYGKLSSIFFFLNSLLVGFNFIYITKHLPQLMTTWNKLDEDFPDSADDSKSRNNSLKFISVFMICALIEHVLSKVEDYEAASICFDHYSTKFEAVVRNIIIVFFRVFAYCHTLGVYMVVTCFYSTVLWNIADVFLITVHIAIYVKLKKFNRKIVRMRFRHDDEDFWLNARQNYVALHEQVKATNSIISCLVMISLLNDFYFVCNQALGAFKWARREERAFKVCWRILIYLQTIGIRLAKHLLLVLADFPSHSNDMCLLERLARLSGVEDHHKNH